MAVLIFSLLRTLTVSVLAAGAAKAAHAAELPSATSKRTFNSTFVMFSAPSQGSTFMTQVMVHGLNLTNPAHRTYIWCRSLEYMNTGCVIDKKKKEIYARCICGPRNCQNGFWKTCERKDFLAIKHELFSANIGFAKDNYAPSDLMIQFHEAGIPVFVFFRQPWHTFPSSYVVQVWYSDILRVFLERLDAEILAMRKGEQLLSLRKFIRGEFIQWSDPAKISLSFSQKGRKKTLTKHQPGGKYNSWEPQCLGHYLRFFPLLSTAIELGIPIVSLESLVLADEKWLRNMLASDLCPSLSVNETQCMVLAEVLIEKRNSPEKQHDLSLHSACTKRGISLPKCLFEAHHQKYLNSTSCETVLKKVMDFCETSFPECARVNSIYRQTAFKEG